MVIVTIISLLLSYRRCNSRDWPASFRPGKPSCQESLSPGALEACGLCLHAWPVPGQAREEPLCPRLEVASTGSRLSGKGACQPANGRQAGAGRPGAQPGRRGPAVGVRDAVLGTVCARAPGRGCPSGAVPAVAGLHRHSSPVAQPWAHTGCRLHSARPKLCVPFRPSPCWAPCRTPFPRPG